MCNCNDFLECALKFIISLEILLSRMVAFSSWIKVAAAGIRYMVTSKFSRSLVYTKKLGFTRQVVFKLGNYFVTKGRVPLLSLYEYVCSCKVFCDELLIFFLIHISYSLCVHRGLKLNRFVRKNLRLTK